MTRHDLSMLLDALEAMSDCPLRADLAKLVRKGVAAYTSQFIPPSPRVVQGEHEVVADGEWTIAEIECMRQGHKLDCVRLLKQRRPELLLLEAKKLVEESRHWVSYNGPVS